MLKDLTMSLILKILVQDGTKNFPPFMSFLAVLSQMLNQFFQKYSLQYNDHAAKYYLQASECMTNFRVSDERDIKILEKDEIHI